MRTLTVGMATYRDFDGVWFTISALRAYHPEVDIVVVDASPTGCGARRRFVNPPAAATSTSRT